MAKKFDIIVVGNFVADVIAKPIDVERMPQKGDMQLVEEVTVQLGGIAANCSIDLAKLGMKVGVIGKIGKDHFGSLFKNILEKNEVDLKGLIEEPKIGTSVTLALIDPLGERTFLHYPGGNAFLSYLDLEKQFSYLDQAKHLHIGYFGLLPKLEPDFAKLLKKIKEKTKITISLDTGGPQENMSLEKIRSSLRHVDIFIPSFDEAKAITKEENPRKICDVFQSLGDIKIIGLKMGKEGCYLRDKNKECFIPIFDIKAVDTLGCGDAFCAGLLAGQLYGWSLYECGKFANAVAACCAMAIGASAGVKTLKETLEFIKKYKN